FCFSPGDDNQWPMRRPAGVLRRADMDVRGGESARDGRPSRGAIPRQGVAAAEARAHSFQRPAKTNTTAPTHGRIENLPTKQGGEASCHARDAERYYQL